MINGTDVSIYIKLADTRYGLMYHIKSHCCIDMVDFFMKHTKNINYIDPKSGYNAIMLFVSEYVTRSSEDPKRLKNVIQCMINRKIDLEYQIKGGYSSGKQLIDFIITSAYFYVNPKNAWLYDLFMPMIEERYDTLPRTLKKYVLKQSVKVFIENHLGIYAPEIESIVCNFLM